MSSNNEEKIKWRTTGKGKYADPNDLIAEIDKYCFRVERLDKKRFWWCVYFRDEEMAFDLVYCKTLEEGKKCCETAYLIHKKYYKK